MSATWVEIQIEADAGAADLLADAAGEIGRGVEIRDAGTLVAAGPGRAVVVALVPPADEAGLLDAFATACERARAARLPIDPVVLRRREAREDEWRDVWKTFWKTTRVGRSFLVRPSWETAPDAAAGNRVIELDPGRAFGTGAHESTRLAIALSEDVAAVRSDVARFLDLGCGSGILSIAAAMLWPAARGLAIDVDPEAAACARENLDRNRIDRVETLAGTLAEVDGPFDIVLANIQADVLTPLAGAFRRIVAPRTAVVLSGLLVEQADGVRDRFVEAGFTVRSRRHDGEWAALLLGAP